MTRHDYTVEAASRIDKHSGDEKTSLTRAEPSRGLEAEVTELLRGLLKPAEVRSLVITKSNKYTISGIVLTACPIEETESGRDFEIGLEGNGTGSVQYVTVDGRRVFPRRNSVKVSSGSR